MFGAFGDWLFPQNFMPHGHCYLWRPDVLWLHVGSDAMIAASYFAIPIALGYFVRKRRAVLPYWWLPLLFAAFITLCGATHLMSIWTVWNPDYVVDGYLKLATGLISAATAVAVYVNLPAAMTLRTPLELQQEVDARTAELTAANALLREEIAERTRIEAQLRESEARYRAIFEQPSQYTVVLEVERDATGAIHDWTYRDANASALELLGAEPHELLGRRMSAVVPDRAARLNDMCSRVLNTGSTERYEARYGERDILLTVFRMGPNAVASCGLDISARVRLESELRDSIEKLAEEDRRKNEFLAMLAHELRNPLAPIRNAVQVLKSNGPESMMSDARNIIERQIRHMGRLLDDLLDLSRITRGRVTLQKSPMELDAAIAAAVEACQPQIDVHRHRLTIDLPGEPLHVDGDLTRLSQVFVNLLTNAAKYTPPGGRIDLVARRVGSSALVQVTDTGVGFAPEMRDRIFEMFAQLDTSLERTQSGLGIGLTLARELVQMHGGRLDAHSDGRGRGSTFSVYLPIVQPQTARQTPAASASAAAPRAGLKILVSDDNRDAAQSLAMMLELEGHHVSTAHDGLAAVELAAELQPDVVLLDIGMPRLNGYQAAQRIRALPNGAAMVLIALTGWGQQDDKARAREAGFDEHLTKPVDPSVLLTVIGAHVRNDSLAE